MTIDQLNKLTDEEVRVMCAERMGWKWMPHPRAIKPDKLAWWVSPDDQAIPRGPFCGTPSGRLLNYPVNLNAAFTLVEKLRESCWSIKILTGTNELWFVFLRHSKTDEEKREIGTTLARAICLGFLAVTEREEG